MIQRFEKWFDRFTERTLQPRCPPDKFSGMVLRLCQQWIPTCWLLTRRIFKGRVIEVGRVLRDSLWYWLNDHSWRAYRQWVAATEPSGEALKAQCREVSIWEKWPVFTVIVSRSDVGGWAWRNTLRSLQRQTYPHWIIRRLPTPSRTDSQQLNEALRHAAGDLVTFLHAGDVLAPDALFEVATTVVRQADLDLVYSDEDQLRGSRRVKPLFKPDWSPDLLLADNYVGALAVWRTQRINELGGFRSHLDGEHHWDLLLRLAERSNRVTHLDKILIHRPESFMPARSSSIKRRVLSECVRRRDAAGMVMESPTQGLRLRWGCQAKPLVSVVIPNRNQPRLIKKCIAGLLQRTDYTPVELIIVDNRSDVEEVLAYYERLRQKQTATIVPYDEPFNYSRACNLGAAAANGELLLFLNNDVEVLHADWLDELAAWALRPETGIVGAKLLYANRRIQHAGMILSGPQRATAHVFRFLRENTNTIFGSTEVYRNFLAVTGACQMMRRELFDDIGGYDENYRLCCSDMAICLEAVRRGFRNVYTPHARLIHHEGASRGKVDPNEEHDMRRLIQLLDDMNIERDPYFHPALELAHSPAELVLRSHAA